MIIDFHVHIFPRDLIENRKNFFDDPSFLAIYGDEKSKMVDRDTLIKIMKKEKIDRAVAMAFPFKNNEYREMMNEYLIESWRLSDGLIIPFLAAPFDIMHLKEWVLKAKNNGAAGIGEIAFYASGFTEHEKEYLNTLLKEAAKVNLPVCVHVNEPVGHSYAGKYFIPLNALYDVLIENSQTKVVLAHWGGGLFFYEMMNEVKCALTHVHYDTAASPYLYDDRIYRVAAECIGHEKILFGSDYPLIAQSRYISAMQNFYSESALKKVLGDNAKDLLGIL